MTNSSRSTKVNLNKKVIVMASPMATLGVKKIGLLLLTVVVFIVMVKLGFWQLDRGNQKLALEQQLQLRADAAPVAMKDWVFDNNHHAIGTKVSLTIEPLPLNFKVQRVYWDNQTWQGKVGYLVFQPVRVLSGESGSSPNVQKIALIELGFIAAGRDRQALPYVAGVVEQQSMVGRLYRKQENPMSQGLMPEIIESEGGQLQGTASLRVQNLLLESLPRYLSLDMKNTLFPYVIQPVQPLELASEHGNVVSEHLPHPWHPLPMSSKRHFGYAVQWFSMASVLLLLAIWFAFRQVKRPT